MSLTLFLESPWRHPHPAYETAPFNLKPAPEFCTSEVTVASLYRSVGFSGYSETDVPKAGRDLERQSRNAKADFEVGRIKQDTWRGILNEVLESPKQRNQSAKRFLQLSPIIPDVSLYSGSARLAGNSWNPGALVQRMIQIGASSNQDSQAIWDRLFQALSVSSDDDVWARWLHEEFLRRRKSDLDWGKSDLKPLVNIPDEEKAALRYPAKQFIADLDAIIQAKGEMTRRQWISMLEAIIRIAVVTHVLWVCSVNDKLWKTTLSILRNTEITPLNSKEQIREKIINSERRYLSYGKAAMPSIRDFTSRYLIGRLGINLVLWALKEKNVNIQSLNSSEDILHFVNAVREHESDLNAMGVLDSLHAKIDEEARVISCKKGIGSNIFEFCRYNLGQRQSISPAQRGYDQGYFLQKRGDARAAPWIFSLGPVAILALVHCCLSEVKGPRSVHRLSEHLSLYGVEIGMDDLSIGDLGRKLRMLGLVLDSPDAESGMLLVPPFRYEVQEQK